MSNKKRYTIVCEECGNKFKSSRPETKYHPSCRQKAYRDRKAHNQVELQRKAELAEWQAKVAADKAERDAADFAAWMNGDTPSAPARLTRRANPEPPTPPTRKTKPYNQADVLAVQMGRLDVSYLYDMKEPPEPTLWQKLRGQTPVSPAAVIAASRR